MQIYNHGQERKMTVSIESVEKLLDKDTYPTSKNKHRKIEVDGEEIRYYNPSYHMFFVKGYSCVRCGIVGQFFALERSGKSNAYSLTLYGINESGDQIELIASRIKKIDKNAVVKVENIEPMCILCNSGKQLKKPVIQTQLGLMKNIRKEYTVLFDGTPVKDSTIIGYCNNATHYGWINEYLLKTHQCIEKQCPFLEKANPSYWGRLEAKKRMKVEFRAKIKEKRIKIQERDEFIHLLFKPYVDIYITSIQEMGNGLKISYIYDKKVDLSNAINTLREKYKCAIYLKATATSIENRVNLIRNRKRTDLLLIPGVGETSKRRLNNIGYYFVEDLVGANPEEIYKRDCEYSGSNVNRRMLNIYRIAVEFAERECE